MEMVLYAYKITKGFLDSIFQQYKTFNEIEISKVIINIKNEQDDIC